MKAKLTITDSQGRVFEGEIDLIEVSALETSSTRRRAATSSPATAPSAPRSALNYSLPVRAFMNRYAKGRSGAEAFTLLVARLAGGRTEQQVQLEQVTEEWNRISGVLGGQYRTMYATRAKDKAWVDSPARGVYVLLPDWTEVLEKTGR